MLSIEGCRYELCGVCRQMIRLNPLANPKAKGSQRPEDCRSVTDDIFQHPLGSGRVMG